MIIENGKGWSCWGCGAAGTDGLLDEELELDQSLSDDEKLEQQARNHLEYDECPGPLVIGKILELELAV